MKLLFFLVLLNVLLLAETSRAETDNRFYGGLGTFFQNMGKISANETGSTSLTGEVYLPELALGYRIQRFFPTLGWTILGNKTGDGDLRRSVMRFDLPFLFPLQNDLEIKAGLGFLLHRIYGDGSTVTLRNGGSTSSFYVPSGSRTARIFYLAAGAGYSLPNRLRFDLDLLLSGALSKRRALHLSFRGGYVF